MGNQQTWVKNAPLLVICIIRPNYLYNGDFNELAEYDTGAAGVSMSLQAEEMGLMAHQIGGFNKEQIVEGFKLPAGFFPITITASGYEMNNPAPEKPRSRKPVEDNFFLGFWGKGIPTKRYLRTLICLIEALEGVICICHSVGSNTIYAGISPLPGLRCYLLVLFSNG